MMTVLCKWEPSVGEHAVRFIKEERQVIHGIEADSSDGRSLRLDVASEMEDVEFVAAVCGDRPAVPTGFRPDIVAHNGVAGVVAPDEAASAPCIVCGSRQNIGCV